jgi:hypothetical protein
MANHVVNSLKFEIKVATKSNFDQLSVEIPELTKTSVAELIDQILSEMHPSPHLLVINKLEIDLGSLRLSNLKADLAQKFNAEFRTVFKQNLQSSFSKITSANELPFIILDEYIRRGVRPQWLSASEATFQDHITKAFSKNPSKFSKQISGYLKSPTQKKRVLENFSEEILIQSVLVEHPLNSVIPSDEISRLKEFFRLQYRHLDANSASNLFKSMLADILIHPQKINTLSGFRAAVGEAIEDRFGSEAASSYQNKAILSGPILALDQTPSVVAGKPLPSNLLEVGEGLIQKFQFFMFHGYSLVDNRPTSYRFRNINTLFETLLTQSFEELVEFLLKYGKSASIKRRFLDSLSQEAISIFFGKVAPQKRKLLEWVVEVFEQVQEKYQPINQTQIQVKKSINEITFELFLNKNLQSISDENYLRLLFKKTALKYGVSYKSLLFMTLKSLGTVQKKQRIFNFNQTLFRIYGKDVLKRNEFSAGDWILFTKEETEQEWSTNYQNKEVLFTLFTRLYQDQYGSLPAAIAAWLETKLQTLSLNSASRLLELWEEFSQKYTLPLGELMIPLLLEKKSNTSLKLSSSEFSFWLNKYSIKGISPSKSVDAVQLLTYLQQNKKMVSAAMLKKIALALPVTGTNSKQLLIKGAELIRPRLASVLPGFLVWTQQFLTKNKAESLEAKLFTWLYHELIILPQSQLSIASLKEKVEEFLSLNVRAKTREEEKPLSLESLLPASQKQSIQQLLKKNKAEGLEVKLFTWLDDQLILFPQGQISPALLKEKVEEFLGLNERDIVREDERPISPVSKMPLVQRRKESSNSAKMVARVLGILGMEEVYKIFPKAKRYNEEILLNLLTTKYANSFYQLLLSHQYNAEFQDAILVQAPKWLKKQFLDFLLQRSSFEWNASISTFISYFEANKWVKLEGLALDSLLEKILWKAVFEGGSFVKEELILEVLGDAFDAKLISTKFWKDLQLYSQQKGQPKDIKNTKSFVNFAALEHLDGFAYLIARSDFKKVEPSILPILESLVYDSVFPVAHPFEGNSSEEFSDYISRLVLGNKTEFLNFFAKVRNPYLTRKFFNLLKYKGLKELIKEKHKREGLAISVEQLERVLKVFNIKDQVQIDYFLRAWLGFLFNASTLKRSAPYFVVVVGELLEEEGILEKGKLDLDTSFALLSKFMVWNEVEKNYFFQQARGWAVVEVTSASLVEFTKEEEIYAYFSELKDPYLKELKGKSFLKVWLNSFFDLASISSLNAFIKIFKNSFYENSYSSARKQELFFKQLFQVKDSYTSFQEAIVSSPQFWIEFRQNNPTFFEQYEPVAVPKPVQMSLIELLNFYLSYGVLPKEEGSLKAFVKKLMESKSDSLAQLRGIFLASLLDSKKKKLLNNLLRYVDEKWFYGLLNPKLPGALDKLVAEVRRRTGSNFFADLRMQHPVDRILFFTESVSKRGSSTKNLVELLLPAFELWLDTKSSAEVTSMFEDSDQKSEILLLIQHASKKVKKVLEEEKKSEQPIVVEPEEVDLGEGVTINNAGMVLCWPFFGRFFAALGLVEQGKFKGQQAEERAVQLLQYLATGLTSFEEWDLSLNKVLCGVSLNTPISPKLELTTEEEELVRKLINGTIFNWEKMRGTRLETFRETFFMREGILYEKDNRWELIVERKAYDVLMDTMTWNISMINLSWMKKRLNVQWK